MASVRHTALVLMAAVGLLLLLMLMMMFLLPLLLTSFAFHYSLTFAIDT